MDKTTAVDLQRSLGGVSFNAQLLLPKDLGVDIEDYRKSQIFLPGCSRGFVLYDIDQMVPSVANITDGLIMPTEHREDTKVHSRLNQHCHHFYPLLLLYVDHGRDESVSNLYDTIRRDAHQLINLTPSHRTRRDSGSHASALRYPGRAKPSPDSNVVGCQLQEWELQFATLHWDWVVQPRRYKANMCQGACMVPLLPELVNTSNHAFMKLMYHSATENRYTYEVPQASCVPIRFRSMSIIYLDDNGNVITKIYPEMIAESCGCL